MGNFAVKGNKGDLDQLVKDIIFEEEGMVE